MSHGSPLLRLSDNLIMIGDVRAPLGSDGLKDLLAASPGWINNATCTVEAIRDESGVNITGVTFPFAMVYLTASNGVYQGNLPNEAVFADGQQLKAEVKAVTTGSVTRTFFMDLYGYEG